MTANRQPPTPANTPAGISGSEYAERLYEEIVKLWGYVGGALSSVAGTNTITASASPSVSAYTSGQKFTFIPANTNTSTVTLNINGLGAKAIRDASGNALAAGDLVAGKAVEVFYDGTNFRIISNNTNVSTAIGQLVLSHELANNSTGGTATSGSEATYPWDKTCINTIPGASVSLAADTFTLPAGRYEGEFIAAIYDVDGARFRLFNVTDGTYEDASTSVFINAFTGSNTDIGYAIGKIVLAPTSTKTYKIVYRVATTKASTGLGVADGLYTAVEQFGYLSLKSTSSISGSAGSSIRLSNGVPSNGLGSDGDLAINYNNGDLYEKVTGSYVLRGNLAGPAGDDGDPGASVYSGAGDPGPGLGNDGDTYNDQISGDVWFKSGGSWALTGYSIIGPPGQDGVLSDEVTRIKVLTQFEYDAIPVKSETTLYFII